MKKSLLMCVTVFVLLVISTTKTHASEGVTLLRSTDPTRNSRCAVYSHLGQDSKYALLVTCRELVYPIEPEDISTYVLWGNPISGGNIIKYGALNYGKAFFKTGNTPFSSLFVTIETNLKGKTPTGPIVMQGIAEPISFLDGAEATFTPTPTAVPEIVEEVEEPASEEEPSRSLTGLKRASVIIAIILMVGAIVALVLIQRSKKR